MFSIIWRLAVATFCLFLLFIPIINLVTFWFAIPLGGYCAVSAIARIWKRNTRAAELSS